LDLQGNLIGDEGLIGLIQALYDTRTLTHLSLSSNFIQDILIDGIFYFNLH
jgi:hypothetical protein